MLHSRITSSFRHYVSSRDAEIQFGPPRLHHKHRLESKHGIIRSGLLRPNASSKNQKAIDPRWFGQQGVTISNELYLPDVFSASEPSKGYTRPIQSPRTINPN